MVFVGPTVVVVVGVTVVVDVEIVRHEQAEARRGDAVPLLVHIEANAGTVCCGGGVVAGVAVGSVAVTVRFSNPLGSGMGSASRLAA
jgi:hypothetical protein